MQLFYNASISEATTQYRFDKDESRHIVKVLRKKEGDHIYITNGKGWCFLAKITMADIRRCEIIITSSELKSPIPYTLHMAVAPTKMNERYEWFLEKATEIGVTEITPVICEHSERKIIKTERFERIIEAATKQSLQYYKPKLNPAVTLNNFLSQEHSGKLFIAHCEDTQRNTMKEVISPKDNVTVLIGPEGDFSSLEITIALKNGFLPLTLGKTRLRTETAAVVACQNIAFINLQ